MPAKAIQLLPIMVLVVANPALAAGFQTFFEQSAAAMGQGAAVVARAADPAAVFYNPAACRLLPGTQMQATINGVDPQTTYSAPRDADTGSPAYEDRTVGTILPIGALYITHEASDRLSLALGVNTPYGLESDWGLEWRGRYYAGLTGITSVYTAPTIAYGLTDNLSLGAGLMVVWSDATVEKAINAPLVYAAAMPDKAGVFAGGAGTPDNDVLTQLSADAWGYGARVGIHWRLGERWMFGAAYQSEVGLDLEGRATYTIPIYEDSDFSDDPQAGQTANQLAGALFPETDAATHIDLPGTLAGGIACAVNDVCTIEVDLIWTGWSAYDEQTIVYDELINQSDVAKTTAKEWRDVIAVRCGMEYRVSDRLVWRAGYAFDQSPIPDENRDPSLAGADRHDLSVGLGYRTKVWALDAAYLRVVIDDSASRLNSTLNGDLTGNYQASVGILALGLTVHF